MTDGTDLIRNHAVFPLRVCALSIISSAIKNAACNSSAHHPTRKALNWLLIYNCTVLLLLYPNCHIMHTSNRQKRVP